MCSETSAPPNKVSKEPAGQPELEEAARKRAAFCEWSARFRRKTAGRPQTPAEVLIREDRDSGHRF